MSYGEAEMYLVVGLGVILGLIALRVAPASPEVVGLSHANRKADYGGLALPRRSRRGARLRCA